MLDKNQKSEYVEITVTCILFIVGCAFGKLGVEYFGEGILAFNIPAIGIFMIGELVLYAIKKKIFSLSYAKEEKTKRMVFFGSSNDTENDTVI